MTMDRARKGIKRATIMRTAIATIARLLIKPNDLIESASAVSSVRSYSKLITFAFLIAASKKTISSAKRKKKLLGGFTYSVYTKLKSVYTQTGGKNLSPHSSKVFRLRSSHSRLH